VIFSLLTWNVFGAAQGLGAFLRWEGIPDGARLTHPDVRAAAARADVVCLQEVWLREAAEYFHGIDLPYKTRDTNEKTLVPLKLGGSGLAVASRFPITLRKLTVFDGPLAGADRFARKGVMHVRLALPGDVELDVFTTHMQSGYGDAARRARAAQLAQIADEVARQGSPERPAILCGDLNVCGLGERRSGEYAQIAERFPDFIDLGAAEDLATYHPHPEVNALAHRHEPGAPEQRLDYVLFRPDRGGRLAAVRLARVLDAPLASDGLFPSDHFGLEARFEVR
jgi:endonuclease/exonuclease/phosphatase family metal-dependent hydrolase